MTNLKTMSKFCVFIIAFFSSFVLIPKASAATDCMFCGGNEELYKQEKQLIERVKILNTVFGDKQIDEITLLATVLHNEGATEALESRYDADWDSNAYKESVSAYSHKTYGITNSMKMSPEDDRVDGKDNLATAKQADLLIAAAIVMADSTGWTGTYNDEAYQKALAGNGLVGNNMDDGPIKSFYNWAFCGVGAVVDILGNAIFNPIKTPDKLEVDVARAQNMTNICTNGYIGGMYKTYELDEKFQQTRKDKIAQEIIDLAHYYKSIVGEEEKSVCSTFGNTQATTFNNMTTEQYINAMGPIAQSDYSRNKIFASVTLAQSIIESGWGKSGLTQQANNMFGIKCGGNWNGECVTMATGEYGASGYYTINDGFRKYGSIEDSVNDHSQFLKNNSRYPEAGVFNATNYTDQIKAIHSAGYATDPNYSSTIINTIQQYNLDKWDVVVNTTSSSGTCSPVGSGEWPIRTIKPGPADKSFTEMESVNNNSSNRGQCVWYARGRAYEIVDYLKDNGKMDEAKANQIKSLLANSYGNGGEIYDNAKSVFNSSNDIRQPKAGSYISWKQPNEPGHVAIIEEVNAAYNTITITEGWTKSGSCPDNDEWNCVEFSSVTKDLDDFYENYGAHYNGGYSFSGYVYFLEPLS